MLLVRDNFVFFYSLSDMENLYFSNLAEAGVFECEEHVAGLVAPETRGRTSHQGTVNRVPGIILGKHLEYEKFGAKQYTVHTVREVYRTEFDSVPPVFFLPNNCSATVFVKSDWRTRCQATTALRTQTARQFVKRGIGFSFSQ